MSFGTILTMAGGLGLFLFGMELMSDSIEKVAGARLRRILEIFTTNRFMGMIVGIIFTGIIQSSSACTVMVVSFVNSGLMNLYQAAGVILGANIGTTITSQLVSFNLSKIAPLILLVGVVVMMFTKKEKVRKVAEVVVGFGILFVGLSTMSQAMANMKNEPQVVNLLMSLKNPFLATLMGFALTAIIQSSSVTVSIVLLLANQDLLPLPITLYIILGCNIGACATAMLASMTGKKDAKRAALIHLLFNIIGTVIIYIALFVAGDQIVELIKSISADNGRFVANAHTLIKIAQVIMLFPFTGWLVKMTYLIVPGEDQKVGYRESYQLKYIGDKVVFNPATAVVEVIKELERAKRPIICAGGGVLLSEAEEELRSFAEEHGIPVVSTMMGIGVMPTEHPLYYGMVVNNCKTYANRAMNESDLLIMVGARVADRAVSQPDLITRNKVLVHIDVDPAEIGKNAGPSIPLVGDAKHIFQDFQKEEFDCNYEEWLTTLNEYRSTMEKKRTPNPDYVDPAAFITRLSEKMQEDGVYVADVGQNQIWSCGYHIVKKGKFLTSGGMGTMGYSIPAAMGAKTAAMDKQVIAVCGDGSFQMSMMELATIRQHNIPVKIIVLKNNYLGMVREYQHYTYKDHYSVVDLSGSPDLEKISAAYDIPYLRLNNMEHVDEILDAFLAEDNTMLLECLIDPMDLVK